MKLVIVSGLSGSGKSVALNMLEDLDYYCIDNMPLAVLESFVLDTAATGDPAYELMAVGVDARARSRDIAGFADCVERLRRAGVQSETIFLRADNDIILKRYSETRRKHPLTSGRVPLAEAIRAESELLAPIAEQADLVIDTSSTTMHQLRDMIRERVHGHANVISLLLESFGYKHGVPGDADFVFDSRCLPNPHWEPGLRALTGQDQAVIGYLESQPLVQQMCEDITGFLDRWIPCFEADNRSYVTIAVGCTGGQHRSVYLVERLAAYLRGRDLKVLVRHRELS
ncbi:MAG TPA: RNase adapter RapZ [Gammaproteobacteria bacterium]|nr:RNase adapter RapZ [Gammaproteobacteria bacterium]